MSRSAAVSVWGRPGAASTASSTPSSIYGPRRCTPPRVRPVPGGPAGVRPGPGPPSTGPEGVHHHRSGRGPGVLLKAPPGSFKRTPRVYTTTSPAGVRPGHPGVLLKDPGDGRGPAGAPGSFKRSPSRSGTAWHVPPSTGPEGVHHHRSGRGPAGAPRDPFIGPRGFF